VLVAPKFGYLRGKMVAITAAPILARHSGRGVVPVAGIEPATFGLQNRCSTI
jgi:hypothetical protein